MWCPRWWFATLSLLVAGAIAAPVCSASLLPPPPPLLPPPPPPSLGLDLYAAAAIDAYNEETYTKDLTLQAYEVGWGGWPMTTRLARFRSYKRNSDLVNSLLSIPKQLGNVGRK